MFLMAIACQPSGGVLFFVAVIQFVLTLCGATPNLRLTALGHNLGLYLSQIASFVSFASETSPFPLRDWPANG